MSWWWRRRESNPRPQALCRQYYVRSLVVWFNRWPAAGQADHRRSAGFSRCASRPDAPLSHVNDTATSLWSPRQKPRGGSIRPVSRPVQRPRGLSRECETLVVGVCGFPDGFTRSLVLGTHCSVSRPTSKPGRPHCRQMGCTAGISSAIVARGVGHAASAAGNLWPGGTDMRDYGSSARLVDVARTLSPIVALTRLSVGRYRSTREPKRMKP